MTTVSGSAKVEGPTTGQRVVCFAAIASALPYLLLKLLWVSGARVGITDPEFADVGSLLALNLLTLLMDAAAIALVLAFTYPWGRRLAAWLVLLPIYVGCGLLGPIVVGVPVAVVATALIGAPAPEAESELPLADWVVPLVYGGFVLLGILLLTAFVLYSRRRWPEVFAHRTPGLPTGDQVLAVAGTLLALVAATLLIADAFRPSRVEPAAASLAVVKSLLALAAVAGVWAMHPPGGHRFAAPMLAGWLGSSALLAWGGWSLLNTIGGTAFVAGEVGTREIAEGLTQLLGGLLLGFIVARAQHRVIRAARV